MSNRKEHNFEGWKIQRKRREEAKRTEKTETVNAKKENVNGLARAGDAVPVIPCGGGEYRMNGPFVSHPDVIEQNVLTTNIQ